MLLMGEEDDEDLEIDPCALSPCTSPIPSTSQGWPESRDATDPLPHMEEILSSLEGQDFSYTGLLIYFIQHCIYALKSPFSE